MITAGVGVFGAVLGGVDYRMDYRTATGGGRQTVLLLHRLNTSSVSCDV
jgi:hypothetical protein